MEILAGTKVKFISNDVEDRLIDVGDKSNPFTVTNIIYSNLCQFLINLFPGKYGGERSGVECDTKTPGCEHMCMNHLFPIGPPFFWTLEIIALSLPTLFFIVYISHKQNQGFAIDEDHCKDNIEVAQKERFQNCSNS